MSASVTPSRPSTPGSPLSRDIAPRVADDWTEHSGVAGHRSLLRRAESKRQIADVGGGSDRRSDPPGSPLAIGAGMGAAELEQLRERGATVAPRESVVNMVSVMILKLAEQSKRRLIRPDHKRLADWDMLMAVLLVFIALLSPFEIAFLKFELATWRGRLLFAVNRVVDLCFLADMCMQFFIMYPDPFHRGALVREHRRIARRYLRGWFLIDLVSIIPFDLVALSMGDDSGKLKGTRIVRLLRLLKLLRMLRASRVWVRAEARVWISYSVLNIFKFVVLMFVFSHWAACMWALLANLEGAEDFTWVTRWQLTRMANGVSAPVSAARAAACDAQVPLTMQLGAAHDPSARYDRDSGALLDRNAIFWDACFYPNELYATCFYWSFMSLTTIGYGDVVPVNRSEHLFVTCTMCIGGCVWAFILGSICAAASNLNPQRAAFQQRMDDLNEFMNARHMDTAMQQRFRTFFIQKRDTVFEGKAQKLIALMSPALAAECIGISHLIFHDGTIVFTRGCPPSYIVAIVRSLETRTLASSESISLPSTLVVLQRGVCSLEGRMVLPQAVWGDDLLLDADSWLARGKQRFFTLTFTELSCLSRERLDACFAEFPRAAEAARKAMLPYMLLRGLSIIAKLIADGSVACNKDAVMEAIDARGRPFRNKGGSSFFSGVRRAPDAAAVVVPAVAGGRAPLSLPVLPVAASTAVGAAGGAPTSAGGGGGDLVPQLLQAMQHRQQQQDEQCAELQREVRAQAEQMRKLNSKIDLALTLLQMTQNPKLQHAQVAKAAVTDNVATTEV